ncbi:ABC transporter permease subunit [Sphingobium sp. H39-3-25]|uniref:ABC transporter permease n=1 Tax=Sphingobium arseniciresistens TaxID=3030834 RepID=UPI0023B933FD|nr:ABC transporter permease subunit [Sphingobium arseniciresistens]
MNSIAQTDRFASLSAASGDRPGSALPIPWRGGLAAAATWALTAALTWAWPDLTPWARTGLLAWLEIGVALLLAGTALLGGTRLAVIHPYDRWFGALAAILSLWQVLTAKTGLLPLPFFPPPQSILEVYTDDAARLFESVWRSLVLLIPGYAIGGGLGFLAGASIGWSKAANYWGHPVLRFVGPLPATAWLPIAFFFFPGSHSASTFLVGLATFFPVAVLTASGVKGVNSAYYDIARTLGGSERFLILKVALPAALPNVFVGLFMGLGSSFAVLIIAEMMGVKAGLGWYLQWAQGWAAYANLYGALIVMALLFSGLISLLFHVRDRVLAWQKGIVRW